MEHAGHNYCGNSFRTGMIFFLRRDTPLCVAVTAATRANFLRESGTTWGRHSRSEFERELELPFSLHFPPTFCFSLFLLLSLSFPLSPSIYPSLYLSFASGGQRTIIGRFLRLARVQSWSCRSDLDVVFLFFLVRSCPCGSKDPQGRRHERMLEECGGQGSKG